MRARFAAFGRADDEGHRVVAAIGGEQDEAEIILGLQMPLFGGAAIPGFGLRQIGGNAAAELIRLPQIELRIGIARERGGAPLGDGALIVAALPRIDAVLDVGMGGRGQHRCRNQRQRQRNGGAEWSHLTSPMTCIAAVPSAFLAGIG